MLVKILNFGCNWWGRYGSDPSDRLRYTKHAAFYNSTGVQCGKKIRRHWIVPGLIRFNGTGEFLRFDVNRCIGRTFSCTEPVLAFGGNRVVFEKIVRHETPDYFLVVISADRYGTIDFRSSEWKSCSTQTIAASQLREKQETMLLMRPGDWVETTLGKWCLTLLRQLHTGAALQLADN